MMQQDAPAKLLYQANEVRALDRHIIEDFSIPGIELMERAARFSLNSLLERWPNIHRIIVLCGTGNNGGDGYLLAALASQQNLSVTLIAVGSTSKLHGDALSAYKMALDVGLVAKPLSDQKQGDQDFFTFQDENTVLIDAMLGTGLNKEVEGDYATAIQLCNDTQVPTLAIDIPSGLSSDTGQPLGPTIQAELTCTFIGKKIGLMTGRGRSYAGELKFHSLGAPSRAYNEVKACAKILSLSALRRQIAARPLHAHKGLYGHVLLIGGNKGYGGAINLAAQACARMGAGLTSVATHPDHTYSLLSRCPEVMVKGVTHANQLINLLSAASVIVIGPGLGRDAWAEQMLYHAIQAGKPMVFDADALNLVASKPQWLNNNTAPRVFTPHPGEAARLLACTTAFAESDRLRTLHQLNEKFNCHIVLKGSGTLICDSDGSTSLCPYGNPGMASGGMGDVLSGMLGALWAQTEWSNDFATQLAVSLHAKAADIAAQTQGERGLLASDLIPIARALLNTKTV